MSLEVACQTMRTSRFFADDEPCWEGINDTTLNLALRNPPRKPNCGMEISGALQP